MHQYIQLHAAALSTLHQQPAAFVGIRAATLTVDEYADRPQCLSATCSNPHGIDIQNADAA